MNLFSSDTARWNAVQSREPAADGTFVYAVRTTRIYCRPVCKARLARRKNVEFFTTTRQAQDAGYRACKRCKPQEVGTMPNEDGVQRVRRLLQQFTMQGTADASSRHNAMTLAEMAALSGLSKWHFHRVFKQLTGVTPQTFLEIQRGERSIPTESPEVEEKEKGAIVYDMPEPTDMQSISDQLLSSSTTPFPLLDSLHLTPQTLPEPAFLDWPQLTDALFGQQYAELEATWAQYNEFDLLYAGYSQDGVSEALAGSTVGA